MAGGVYWVLIMPSDSAVENLFATQELQKMPVPFLGQEDPLQEGITTHSSILAWWIPWTEEPGKLQSIGLQRVRYDWSNSTHTHTLCVCVMCNNSKLLTCIKSFNTRATPWFGYYYYYFTEEDLRCREVNQVAQGHSVIRYEPRWFVLLGVSLFTTCQFIAGL